MHEGPYSGGGASQNSQGEFQRGRGGRGRGRGRHGGREHGGGGGGRGGGGGGGGGRRGGGGGRATWGNPEWRKAELARRAAEKPANISAAQVAQIIEAFKASGEEERVVPEITSTASFRAFEEAAQAQGLYCKQYGKGKETNVVVSVAPLARHRAAYVSNHLITEPFEVPPQVLSEVQHALRQFAAPGLQHGHKRARGRDAPSEGLTSARRHALGEDEELAERMRAEQELYQGSAAAQDMMAFRRKLPSFHARDEFLAAVDSHQVVIVSGETGCGKTTQLPQFLLEAAVERGAGPATSIVCTQPRRISAVSIAQRVAQERGELVGRSVGYRIRLEAAASPDTRLLFCTSGVLLRRLTVDESITSVSHVIVDEIHERGVNEDLLLVILKAVMRRRPDLKVILMSATLNADKFAAFFPGAATVYVSGFTFPVTIHYLADALSESGVTFRAPDKSGDGGGRYGGSRRDRDDSRPTPFDGIDPEAAARGMPPAAAQSLRAWWAHTAAKSAATAGKGMLQPDFVATFLQWLHTAHPDGAILVFCTGFEDIKEIHAALSTAHSTGRLPGAVVIPLHGSMPTIHQQSIFQRPPPGQRKIVLATNIAETSITIDDVEIVVDCGLQKVMSYDSLNKIRQLAPSWISQANAKQRAGRAGRVQAGTCYRLYPKEVFEQLQGHMAPEMRCMPLEAVVLQLKSIGVGAVRPFLGQAMDPPEEAAVQNAIARLQAIGAMDANEDLTPLGGHLQQLPVEPAVGRLLIVGAVYDCLDPVLTIAASLTHRSPFVMPLERRDEADAARRRFAGDAASDHWALLNAANTFQEMRAERRFGELRAWCSRNFVTYGTMELICNLRMQLAQVLHDSGFLSNGSQGGPRGQRGGFASDGDGAAGSSRMHETIRAHSTHADEPCLVNAMLVAGLFPNVAAVMRKGRRPPMCFTDDDGRVGFHPSSILMGMDTPPYRYAWAVFTEKLMTTEIFLTTATEVSPGALLLFGGELRRRQNTLTVVDGFIEFETDAAGADLITEMRNDMDHVLQSKLETPNADISQFSRPLIQASVQLLRYC